MIHQYKLNEFNIVLDTFSGAVHCVDDVTYDIIKLYDEKVEKSKIEKMISDKYPNLKQEEIKEAIAGVDELIENKQLFTNDIFKGKNLDLKNPKKISKEGGNAYKKWNIPQSKCWQK